MVCTAWVRDWLGQDCGLCKGFAPQNGLWSGGGAQRRSRKRNRSGITHFAVADGGGWMALFMRLT